MATPHSPPAECIEALLARAKKTSTFAPLGATQVALGHRGELVAFETFGRARFGGDGGSGGGPGGEPESVREADNDTLFSIYSVTKAIVSSASWILLQEGKLALSDRVVQHIPEFGAHGKHAVTVEQLLTHTAGFPKAQLPTADWPHTERRLRHFAEWKLEWEPGSRFVYHGTATLWVLAELIERVAGVDYRGFIRGRIFEPLGLSNTYIGLPAQENRRVADVVAVGEPATGDQKTASPVDAPAIDEELCAFANDPENRSIGGPGGGGIATATDISLFYQAILADAEGRGAGIWRPEALRDAWTIRNEGFVDPMTKQPALRGLGVVMAGPEGKMWRGFSEDCSPRAFGHMGAGGQIAWADPETGLSFAFLTCGAQQNPVRQGANGFRLSTLAAACAPAGATNATGPTR